MKLRHPLNAVQLHILKLFSFCDDNDQEVLNELKDVLLKFYQDKVDQGMEQICKEKGIDQHAADQMMLAHDRIHNTATQWA